MYRRELLNGKNVCKSKDMFTECENWSSKLQIQNVKKGLWTKTQYKRQFGQKKDDLKILVLARGKNEDRYLDNRN